eukprot:1595097-Amphidinium_carterae.1
MRTLLYEARHHVATVFYYGRWEALLDIGPEAEALRLFGRRIEHPPGLEDIQEECRVVDPVDLDEYNAAMAADSNDALQDSYAHLFVDEFGDLEAFEREFADNDAVEIEQVEKTEAIEPLFEYEVGDLDAE